MTIQVPLSLSGPPDAFAKAGMPDQSVLQELLRYDPASGKLYWRERAAKWFSDPEQAKKWNAKWVGREALANASGRYKGGSIFGRHYWAHRVIFRIVTGVEPVEVDHIDGNTLDNRWENLREVDRTRNMRNAFRRKDNTSGVTGVSWHKAARKWRSRITEKGNHVVLGYFNCFGEAIKARKLAHATYGYAPRHGSGR